MSKYKRIYVFRSIFIEIISKFHDKNNYQRYFCPFISKTLQTYVKQSKAEVLLSVFLFLRNEKEILLCLISTNFKSGHLEVTISIRTYNNKNNDPLPFCQQFYGSP